MSILPISIYSTWNLEKQEIKHVKNVNFLPLKLISGEGIDCIYTIHKTRKMTSFNKFNYILTEHDIFTGEEKFIKNFDGSFWK